MAVKRSKKASKSRKPKKIKRRASAGRKAKSRLKARPKAKARQKAKARPRSKARSTAKARPKSKAAKARPKPKRSSRPAAKRATRRAAGRAPKVRPGRPVERGVGFAKLSRPNPAGLNARSIPKGKVKLARGASSEGAPQVLLELEAGPPPAALTRDPSLGPMPPMPKKRRGKGGQLNTLDYPGESLTVGMPAPEFSLPSTLGRRVTLSEFRGKRVILYYYPKDDTPGCTMEACGFRDSFPRIESKDAIVLGISLDDELSHERFAQKYNLPFPLLSDKDAAVSRQYGTYKEKSLYGRSFWGIERTTFVIDREGKVEHVFRRVKVEGHAEEVMATLAL